MKDLTFDRMLEALEAVAPRRLAEGFDNPGLLLRCETKALTKVLFALDLTPTVAQEASDIGADLVVTHHPIFFHAVQRLDIRQPEHAAVMHLIRHGISHFAAHTNWDAAKDGVNATLCDALGLQNAQPVQPCDVGLTKLVVFVPDTHAEALRTAIGDAGAGQVDAYSHCSFSARGEGRFLPLEGAHPAIGNVGALERVPETRVEAVVRPEKLPDVLAAMRRTHPYESIAYDLLEECGEARLDRATGMLRVGDLPEAMPLSDFARLVSERLDIPALRFTGPPERAIRRVAVCGGAGGTFLAAALSSGADAFVTGEVSHHVALEADALQFGLIDAGHYETEKPAVSRLIGCLQAHLGGVQYNTEFILSSRERAPMRSVEAARGEASR